VKLTYSIRNLIQLPQETIQNIKQDQTLQRSTISFLQLGIPNFNFVLFNNNNNKLLHFFKPIFRNLKKVCHWNLK